MADKTNINSDEDYKALQDFLLDISCLDDLNDWISKVNIFNILKVSKTEIRHSNVLAWLLNPNENHGLGGKFLTSLIRFVAPYIIKDTKDFPVLLLDGNDFTVERERWNIDILAHSPTDKVVICIENKILSKEHNNQLERYRNTVEETFPEYKHLFLYLSPLRDEPSDEEWHAIGYEDIQGLLEKVIEKTSLTNEARFIIDNYLDIIRREIVGDKELKKICTEIYSKHQKALDLIYENKQDKAMELADMIHEWAKKKSSEDENFEYDPDKSGKSYTRYKTKKMSNYLPDVEKPSSGWKTKNYYFYEIRNYNGEKFTFQLALSSKDIPDELRNKCDVIYETSQKIAKGKRRDKEDWIWRTPFSTGSVSVREELDKEDVFSKLDKKYEETRQFEEKLFSLLAEEGN